MMTSVGWVLNQNPEGGQFSALSSPKELTIINPSDTSVDTRPKG
jgi:hypothetical protein